MPNGTIRGNPVVWDEAGERWLWADSGAPAEPASFRPCAQCGRTPEPCVQGCPERHDPCIGHLEGIVSACCGHGVFTGYVKWPGSENVREGWFKSVRLSE